MYYYSTVYKTALPQIIKKLAFCPTTKFPNLLSHLPLSGNYVRKGTTGPCGPVNLSLCSLSSVIHILNDNGISPIPSYLPKQYCDQYLHTTYECPNHSHGYPLQSTVTNFYICLHCFVAKFFIHMFQSVHVLK